MKFVSSDFTHGKHSESNSIRQSIENMTQDESFYSIENETSPSVSFHGSTVIFNENHSSRRNSSTSNHSQDIPSIPCQTTHTLLFPDYPSHVFYCLRQTIPPRKQCLQLITSPWFERISIFIILLNCITLGMHQPCTINDQHGQVIQTCDTIRCQILKIIDDLIFILFFIEMCIKIIGMGFIGKRTYLADPWNRLDFIIILAGSMEWILPGDNLSLSAVRTIRVLRPLRAINRVPSMRTLVMLLLDTLPMLANVLLLCFFVFFIFGIVGVQLWKGLLRNRCFLQFNATLIIDEMNRTLPSFYVPTDRDSFICSPTHGSGMTKCSDIPKLRKGNLTCELDMESSIVSFVDHCINWNQYYQTCRASDQNPFANSISFDNIGLAWIVIFQIISLESWVNIMYYIQDAHSFWDWIYFVFLIVIGSFFLINLCLVVIAAQFSETKQREAERLKSEQNQKSSLSTESLGKPPGTCWEETVRYLEYIFCLIYKRVKLCLQKTHQQSVKNSNEENIPPSDINPIREGIRYHLKIIQQLIIRLVKTKHFRRLFFTVIVMNSLSMAVEYHGQPAWLTTTIEYSNVIFTCFFAIEMMLKITADGYLMYIKDGYNVFDSVIVLMSVIELQGNQQSGLSVLRTFRLLRLLKLIRFMPTLRRQLIVMLKTVDDMTTFFSLLILFIFIFSILGMNLFACKFCKLMRMKHTQELRYQCSRKNFDSLLWATLSVFQVLTQEDWSEIMYDGMQSTTPWSALYFVALMSFGNYVLFNLLVAILVEGFSNDKMGVNDSNNCSYMDQAKMETETSIYGTPTVLSEDDMPMNTHNISPPSRCQSRLQNIFQWYQQRQHYALFILSPQHRLRKICQALIQWKTFDLIILSFIGFNCITMIIERPSIGPLSLERRILNYSNYLFTVIFAFEMILRVLANGFIIGHDAYLHTGWNVMDGLLVLISIVDLSTMHRNQDVADGATHFFGMLRVFRLLRTLRPLRVINRAPGLKLVVHTLLSSLKPIGQIVFMCCAFFIIFGILGVQLFRGKFFYCDGPLARHVTTRKQCEELHGHLWRNQQYNFDNLFQALLALFVLASKDGWVQIMYHGIDAVAVDVQPIPNYSEAKAIYFVSFLLLVGFLVLNMFVGVVVENFHKCRSQIELEEKELQIVAREKRFQHKWRRMSELPYYLHFSPCRRYLHRICTSKYFDLIIAIVIGLNVITMSLEHYHMSPILESILDYFNRLFTVIFILEAISKMIALGLVRYFKERWNQLDVLIVLLSMVGIVMEQMKNEQILPINPTLIRVMRVLRITRVLKLLKMAKGIRSLLSTVVQALPQVGNLGLLFFLLFFIFTALGVELFGKLECSEKYPCSGLDKHAHFKNFGMAFLTLFRIATGDNWNTIMKDALRQEDSPNGSKIPFISVIAPVYFVVFVLMAQFVLVNVVVAVLMKKLEESHKMMADDAEMEDEIRRRLAAMTNDHFEKHSPLLTVTSV